MIKEAIILAGGLGTRLREAVPDLPKCMAPVLAKPFIGYLVDFLQQHGITRFIFSLGYKANIVEQYIRTQYANLDLCFSVEAEPLGTGGAIKLACSHATQNTVAVLNGDTFFGVDLNRLGELHKTTSADCTLALKPMQRFSRYGAVAIDSDHSILNFREKQYFEEGLINGGVYALEAAKFLHEPLPVKFSFEKDYLETYIGQRRFYGLVQDDYFIDIGIPADFERAQTELILNIRNIDA